MYIYCIYIYVYILCYCPGPRQNKSPDKEKLLLDMKIHFFINKVTISYRGASWFLKSIYLVRNNRYWNFALSPQMLV